MHGKAAANFSQRPVKVFLALSSLHGGGAERVAVHLLNRLDPARFDVTLGLLRKAGPYLDQIDDPRRVLAAPQGEARFNFDGSNRAQYAPGKLIASAMHAPLALRRMITEARPDVVLSFLKGTNLLVWLALMNLGAQRPRWIAREGNNLLAVTNEEAPNAAIRHLALGLTRRAYRRADALLTNASDMAQSLTGALGLDPARVRMINNPVDLAAIAAAAAAPLVDPPARPFILTAGRLDVQKAQDVLIRAYAASGAARSHDLVILGEGSRAAELLGLVGELGLAGQVRFPGFTANPYAWMARSDLFVLPSRWEGFPTVAVEALACGVPVVLSDCAFGPRDVIEPGLSGELVPVDDVPTLAATITALLNNPARRAALGAAGKARAQRFEAPRLVARYAELLDEVAGQARLNPSLASSPAPERG